MALSHMDDNVTDEKLEIMAKDIKFLLQRAMKEVSTQIMYFSGWYSLLCLIRKQINLKTIRVTVSDWSHKIPSMQQFPLIGAKPKHPRVGLLSQVQESIDKVAPPSQITGLDLTQFNNIGTFRPNLHNYITKHST